MADMMNKKQKVSKNVIVFGSYGKKTSTLQIVCFNTEHKHIVIFVFSKCEFFILDIFTEPEIPIYRTCFLLYFYESRRLNKTKPKSL